MNTALRTMPNIPHSRRTIRNKAPHSVPMSSHKDSLLFRFKPSISLSQKRSPLAQLQHFGRKISIPQQLVSCSLLLLSSIVLHKGFQGVLSFLTHQKLVNLFRCSCAREVRYGVFFVKVLGVLHGLDVRNKRRRCGVQTIPWDVSKPFVPLDVFSIMWMDVPTSVVLI